jgi:recombinational DNA repair ATPase RecF
MINIKTIYIKAFRGISELKIPLEGRGLILKGENGTGKSSIVDAVEYFFTDKVYCLEGIQGLSTMKHAHHVKHDPNELDVSITFSDNSKYSKTFSVQPTPSKYLTDYFRITESGAFILRRSQLLQFIMSQPAKRFEAIGKIIGIYELDHIEIEMLHLKENLDREVENCMGTIIKFNSYFTSELGAQSPDKENILNSLNTKISELGFDNLDNLDNTEIYVQKILKMLGAAASSENAIKVRQIETLKEKIEHCNISTKIIDEIKRLDEELLSIIRLELKQKIGFINLFKEAKSIVESQTEEICPLCETPYPKKELLAKITSKIEELSELSQKYNDLKSTSRPTVQSLKTLVVNLSSNEYELKKWEISSGIIEEYKKNHLSVSDFTVQFENSINLEETCNANDINLLYQAIEQTNFKIIKELNNKLSTLELSEHDRNALTVIKLVENTKINFDRVERENAKLTNIISKLKIAIKIYENFVLSKNLKIQDVFDSIQTEVEKYYKSLHPYDDHKNISLIVKKRASAELRIDSFGKVSEDPRAYSSEGHLDSLGLCIFLAFVKRFNTGCSLLILDDVVTTIDSGHRGRLAQLLFEEFRDYQQIITTHDNIWFDQLYTTITNKHLGNDFLKLNIIDWNIDDGPVIEPCLIRKEEIEEKLQKGDKNAAGNATRIYLESLLKKVCIKWHIAIIPNESNKHTVGEMFDPAEKKIREKLKDGDEKEEILKAFTELRNTKIMGNLLSHYNIDAMNISLNEVKEFFEDVKSLEKAFKCSGCDTLLMYSQDLKIICCPRSNCTNKTILNIKN